VTTIFAYLDPGSSSMIVQMFLGGLAAAGVALKLYWRRFLKFLHIRKEDPEVDMPARKARRQAEATGTPAPEAASAEDRAPVETTKS
jgi:hypothetical protein